ALRTRHRPSRLVRAGLARPRPRRWRQAIFAGERDHTLNVRRVPPACRHSAARCASTTSGGDDVMRAATPEELRTITLSRMLDDHRVVFAGVGAPLVASAHPTECDRAQLLWGGRSHDVI